MTFYPKLCSIKNNFSFMKKIFSVIMLLPALLTLAQAQGIEFFHGTWPEALEKAKTEQKLIFVDAFASWCGPCKRMASTVFTEQEVGDYFNANFIPLKIDMEKPENAEFAGKYPVHAYPTLYFIDAEGKVVIKNVGAMSTEQILEFAKKALGATDPAVDYEKGYAEGNRDPQFLYDYVRWLNRQGKPSLKVTNEYLNTQKDYTTPFNLKFILEGATEADSRVFDLLIKNREAMIKQEGAEKVNARVEAAAKNTIKKAIEFRSEDLLKEAKTKYAQARPDRAGVFGYEADMQYYAAVKDPKNYLKAATGLRKDEIKNNAAQLHDLVIKLLRAFPQDENVLEVAEKWAKNAAETGGLPEYYMTWAETLKRQGKKDEALKVATKAKSLVGNDDNGMKAKIDYFIRSLDGRS